MSLAAAADEAENRWRLAAETGPGDPWPGLEEAAAGRDSDDAHAQARQAAHTSIIRSQGLHLAWLYLRVPVPVADRAGRDRSPAARLGNGSPKS
jgi:hypothetical protein